MSTLLSYNITTISICFLYLLILTSSSTNLVTSPFLVLSVLKTSNNLFIGSVLILYSFTSCLLIPIWLYPESTNAYNCNSFLFAILILVCIFNSLSLLFLQSRITYWFWELVCSEVYCIVPTLNLWQNPPAYCYSLCLTFL